MENDKLIRKRKNLVRQNATDQDELLDNDPILIPSQSLRNKHKGKKRNNTVLARSPFCVEALI